MRSLLLAAVRRGGSLVRQHPTPASTTTFGSSGGSGLTRRVALGRCRLLHVSAPAAAAPPPLDFAELAANREAMRENIESRRSPADVGLVLELHATHKQLSQELVLVQEQRNRIAAEVKLARGPPTPEQIAEGKTLKARAQSLGEGIDTAARDLDREARQLPNTTHAAAPPAGTPPRRVLSFGPESHKALVERMNSAAAAAAADNASGDAGGGGGDTGRGSVRVMPFRDHTEIAKDADLLDFEAGARVAGSKFFFLKNEAALLEVALTQWALMRLRARGFTPTTCPDLVRNRVIRGCGFVPRGDSSQIYSVEGSDLSLAATAEIPLAGMHADCILDPARLPLKMAGLSHCFRTEAGSLGRDTHGLYRVHQFTKVEMFAVCAPEDGPATFQTLVDTQRELHEELGLHGVQLEMPVDELGASAHRKVDTEVWLPSRGGYGEVCSASDCTDYQSRRLGIRIRREEDGAKRKTQFAHTLNATACAVPRVLIALLEQHQQPDGSVRIPPALQPFMQGQETIPAPPAVSV